MYLLAVSDLVGAYQLFTEHAGFSPAAVQELQSMQASILFQHKGSRVCRLHSRSSTRALACAGSLSFRHEGSRVCRLHSHSRECAGFTLVPGSVQASLSFQHEGSSVCTLLSRSSTRALEHVSSAVCGAGTQLLPGLQDLSSPTRDQTLIPWIRRQILNPWTIREVPPMITTANIYTFMKAFISVREGWIIDKVMGTFCHSFKK